MTNIAFFGFAAANSFAQATWKGIQQAAKASHVKTKFFDPNFDSGMQVSQIQDAITSHKYQAFIIQANDGNAVVPVVKQAIKAHIKVVGEFCQITILGIMEFQWDELHAASALLPSGIAAQVGEMAAECGEQEGAQFSQRWVGVGNELLLEHAEQEALGGVLGVFRAEVLSPGVGVERLPVDAA